MSLLSGISGVFSGDPIKEGAQAKEAALRAGLTQYGDLAGQGRNALQTNYTQALQPWMALQPGATAGRDSYLDATGVNGPEGLARARTNFSASPGLDFAQQEARRSVERSGVAGGQASGNILQAIGDRAQQIGLGDWHNYVNDLSRFDTEAGQIAGAQSGIYTGLGSGLANSFTGQAGASLDTAKGIGDAQNDAAMASYVGGQNALNFGLQAGKVAASFTPWGAAANAAGGLMGNLNKGGIPGGGNQPTSYGPIPRLF